MRTFTAFTVPMLFASAALAAPVSLTHAGYLLDAADGPLEASPATMRFTLWDDADAGNKVWPADPVPDCAVEVRGGYYSVQLGGAGGCGTGLDTTHVPPASPRWLEIRVGAITLEPRVRLDAAPAATNADRIGGLSLAELDARYALAGGTITGNGAGLTHLQASALEGSVSDAQLASGADLLKLAGAQTITGTKTFHTSGSAPFAVDATNAGLVVNLNAERVGGQKLFTLPFNCPAGQVLTGFSSTGGTLTPTCTVAPGAGSGGSSGAAASSCNAIKVANPLAQDGLYWVDPDGGGPLGTRQVFCDMTTDGGGWTKFLHYPNVRTTPCLATSAVSYLTPTRFSNGDPMACLPIDWVTASWGAGTDLLATNGNWVLPTTNVLKVTFADTAVRRAKFLSIITSASTPGIIYDCGTITPLGAATTPRTLECYGSDHLNLIGMWDLYILVGNGPHSNAHGNNLKDANSGNSAVFSDASYFFR